MKPKIKPPITEAAIRKYVGDDINIRRKLLRRFEVSTHAGHRIYVSAHGLDLRQCMHVEGDEELDELRYDLFCFWEDLEGGFSLSGKNGLKGQALLDKANALEEAGFKVRDDNVTIARLFGPDAVAKKTWEGWRISQPDTEDEIRRDAEQLRQQETWRRTVHAITEEMLREDLFCEEDIGGFERKIPGEWEIVVRGKKVVINEWQIDLRQFFVPGRKPWESDDNEETFFEIMTLAHEAWGAVPIHGLGFHDAGYVMRYADAYGFKVDDNRFKPFGNVVARRYFEHGAKGPNFNWIKWGWPLRLPNGESVLFIWERGELGLKAVHGDAKLFEAALRLCRDMSREVVVCGSQETCLAAVSHAERLGIECIPEIYPSFLGTLIKINLAQWVLFILLAGAGLGAGGDGLGTAFVIADVVPVLVWMISQMIPGRRRRKARERGRALTQNKFASAQASNRRADVTDLQKGGWT